MSLWGVNPKMLLYLLPFILLFGALHLAYFPLFVTPINTVVMVSTGILLIIIGFILYLKTIRVINSAYRSRTLLTSGMYAHVRHPLYCSFILLFTPGIVLLFNSWILFIIPLVYYCIFRIMIRREEQYCIEQFGEQYIEYRKNVNAIFPKLLKKHLKNQNGGR